MPTNRMRRPRNSNKVFYNDWQLEVLKYGTYPEDQGFEGLHFFYDDRYHDSKRDLYHSIRDDFLKDWIDKNPCSRPWAWYRYDAPRQDDADVNCYWHNTLPVERQHISGGKRCQYAYTPSYFKGVFEYYHYTNNDLPMFESEAAYLQRLDLLRKEEKQHLEKHPELLEPESIVDIIPGVESQIYL